jgi:hypothetical protein
VNPIAVGTAPRYTAHTSAPVPARPASSTRPGANGTHATAPMTQARNVICSPEVRASSGFWATTPPA